MLALVFKAYAKKEIDAQMFHRLVTVIETLPAFEVQEVRKFNDIPPDDRSKMNTSTLQALMTAGLANALSGYGCLVYKPSEVCEVFVRLNLDGRP